MAVTMITIAMASSGLFEFEESAMIIYGTQAGVAALTFMFSFNFKGRARQVVMAQALFKSIITTIFIIFFLLEVGLDIPLLISFANSVNMEIGLKVAMLTLLVSYVGAALVVVLNSSVYNIVEKLYKPSQSEVLSEPTFIGSVISENSETGLLLVEKEQFEVLQRLPKYFEYIRSNDRDNSKHLVNPDEYHAAFIKISKEISEVLSKISGLRLGESESGLLIRTMKSHEQLVSLESIVHKISAKMNDKNASKRSIALGHKVLDSMDFMILTEIEALRSKDLTELELLKNLTSDRGEIMDSVRKKYMQSEKELTEEDRNFVLDITILFENGVATLSSSVSLLI